MNLFDRFSGSSCLVDSIKSADSETGFESVSGYILSGPGRTLSKIFVPSGRDLRVSLGTPLKASSILSSIVSSAVVRSSSFVQKIICASFSEAFSIFFISFQSI